MAKRENDKDLLRNYLSESVDNQADRQHDEKLTEKILNVSGRWQAEVDSGTEAALQEFKSRLEVPKKEGKVISLSLLSRIAAMLIVGLGIGYYFLNQPAMVTYQTALGERLEITLPDQSTVFLDAESILTYDERSWSDKRSLQLTGKAYFEVEEGKDFSVTSDRGTVTVLGTSFTVTDRSASYTVECYTGKVAVKTVEKQVVLEPGNRVELIDKVLSQSSFDIETNSDWITGVLHFSQKELSLIFKELERQYNVQIDYNSSEEMLYSGSLDLNQTALKNLEKITLIMGLELSGTEKSFRISYPAP